MIKLRREMSNIEKTEEIKCKKQAKKKIWIHLRSYRRMRVKVPREDEELEKEMTQMLRGAHEDDLEEEDCDRWWHAKCTSTVAGLTKTQLQNDEFHFFSVLCIPSQ